MNKKHQNLLQELAPRPLPSKKEYDKEQKAVDPNKPAILLGINTVLRDRSQTLNRRQTTR